jgi:hypothetical protein
MPRQPSPATLEAIAKAQLATLQRRAAQLDAMHTQQPSADLKSFEQAELGRHAGSGKSTEDLRPIVENAMRGQLAKAHQHASDLAGGTSGEVTVTGYRHGGKGPVAARVGKTTLDKELGEWYGKDWGRKRESMVNSQARTQPQYQYRNLSNQDENLRQPIYVVRHSDPSASSFASPGIGKVELVDNDSLIGSAGFDPQYLRWHELSHLVAPYLGQGRLRDKLIGQERSAPLWLSGRGDSSAQSNANMAWHHMAYSAKSPEFFANLAHMMRLEHGLSGRPVVSPEDRLRVIQSWRGSRPQLDLSAPSMHKMFGPDPILQHGPDAGNPAHGYNFMREFFRNALQYIKDEPLSDMMGPLGSASPRTEDRNAVV